jgi:tight adherence protein B
VGTVALTMLLGAAVGGVVGNRLAGPMMGAALAALGTFAPIAVLKRQQAARSKKFEQQLPEAVDMLVNAMKAGYSLQAAMKFIGDEMPEPIGPEFTRFYDEQRLGMEVRAALVSLQDRVGTLDMKMFVTALLIQRETGGNLAEILTNISSLMRERVALLGQIDVLTAEPRMSAIVLTALPILIFAVINFMNPSTCARCTRRRPGT